MARYKYHNDWQISYQYDCNFWVTSRSLRDALWIATLKDRDAHISVHADCELAGIRTVAHVGISVKAAQDKSVTEILELFDAEVDKYIACRVKTGQWTQDSSI